MEKKMDWFLVLVKSAFKSLLLIVLLLMCLSSRAQKETLLTMDAGDIKYIVFNAEEVFKITVSTAPVETISLKTHSNGEYFNQIRLDSEVVGQTLYINSQFPEILQSGYDKLSAHKVFALEVILEIPQNISVDISSNLASVFAAGHYKNLVLQLKSGSCYLTAFVGNAVVNTFNGNIEISTSGAELHASSRHGQVILPDYIMGSHKIVLTSINGNIRVLKTK